MFSSKKASDYELVDKYVKEKVPAYLQGKAKLDILSDKNKLKKIRQTKRK